MRFRNGLLLAVVSLAALAVPLAHVGQGLRIDPSDTRVGIARVWLDVDDLQIEDNRLSGTYQVRIPLAPFRNDRGNIDISLEAPLAETARLGGVVSGNCHSVLDGRTHRLTCDFEPDGSVVISVDTGDRVLVFKTRYTFPS